MHLPIRTRLLALTAAVVLPLTLSACQQEDPDATDDTGATAEPSVDPEDAMLDYAQCMRDNGVPMEDPQGGEGGRGLTLMGDGIDPEVVQAAEEKCGEILEAAMPEDGGPELPAEQKEALLAAAQCMRDRGWKVADPEFDGGKVTQRLDSRSGIDPGDPKFQSDSQECQQEAGVEMPDDAKKVG